MNVVKIVICSFALATVCACSGVPKDVVLQESQQIVLTTDAVKAGITKCKGGEGAMCDQASNAVDDIKAGANKLAARAK